MEKFSIDDVELSLSSPTEMKIEWIGQKRVQQQLLASWLILADSDLPLTPRIIGPPGVGKTTMAYATARSLGQPSYFYQCTMDTRPEDLLITPVISENQQIKYIASPLVTAMIKGGILILDEGNRMSEKSWASLAPLLDMRRYIESQIAGIKVEAHPEFRMVVTMNSDASTFELPEYIISRLQPIIELDFPDAEEERQILKMMVPFAPQELIDMVIQFLQAAHGDVKPYTIRAGIQIVQYTLKLQKTTGDQLMVCFYSAVQQILGDDALQYM